MVSVSGAVGQNISHGVLLLLPLLSVERLLRNFTNWVDSCAAEPELKQNFSIRRCLSE